MKAALTASEWRMASRAWEAMKRGHDLTNAHRRAGRLPHAGCTIPEMDALIWRYRAAVTGS